MFFKFKSKLTNKNSRNFSIILDVVVAYSIGSLQKYLQSAIINFPFSSGHNTLKISFDVSPNFIHFANPVAKTSCNCGGQTLNDLDSGICVAAFIPASFAIDGNNTGRYIVLNNRNQNLNCSGFSDTFVIKLIHISTDSEIDGIELDGDKAFPDTL